MGDTPGKRPKEEGTKDWRRTLFITPEERGTETHMRVSSLDGTLGTDGRSGRIPHPEPHRPFEGSLGFIDGGQVKDSNPGPCRRHEDLSTTIPGTERVPDQDTSFQNMLEKKKKKPTLLQSKTAGSTSCHRVRVE